MQYGMAKKKWFIRFTENSWSSFCDSVGGSVIAFLKTMVSYYDSNMRVFDWMNDENKLMDIFMYWLVPICVIIDGIIFYSMQVG